MENIKIINQVLIVELTNNNANLIISDLGSK